MKQISHKMVREHYDSAIGEKYEGRYEFNRWMKTTRWKLDYEMTRRALVHQVQKLSYKKYLEVGPGPGTWTDIFTSHSPHSDFHLVDISEEMRKQFVLEGRENQNIKYEVGDFMDTQLPEKYDLFVSIRAFEYFSDKDAVCKKIMDVLSKGGVGIIITKNPNYGITKKKDDRPLHTAQIAPRHLANCLQNAGLEVDLISPVIMYLPVIDRMTLLFSKLFFSLVYTRIFRSYLSPFTESYIVVFHKA